ncbi:MAG: glycine cleavage T C-terminal barrel domain-containing protein, partial [Rhodoglobus sp.]
VDALELLGAVKVVAVQHPPPSPAKRGEGKRAGRAGYEVFDGDDAVGVITSGALSPTLGYPIAMAYVDLASSAPGYTLDIDVRGSRIAASVVPLPFYKKEVNHD